MFFSKYIKQNKYLYTYTTSILSFFVWIFRKIRRVSFYPSETIAIIALYKLGDTVFSLQAIKNIAEYHINKKIVVLCFPESKSIYNLVFNNLEFIEVNHEDIYLTRIVKSSVRKNLKALKPIIIYDITGHIVSASIIFLSNAPTIVGTNDIQYRHLYTHYKKLNNKLHLVDLYSDCLSMIIPEVKRYALCTDQRGKPEYILIHPFAGWEAKEWNFDKFVTLGKELQKTFNVLFLLPQEKSFCSSQLKSENLPFRTPANADELIETIKGAQLLIGNDSGPVHIASLFNIPTFTIYGPTNPKFHIPRTGNNKYIFIKLACSPGELKWCGPSGGIFGCNAFECMNKLDFHTVYKSIGEFIDELELKTPA